MIQPTVQRPRRRESRMRRGSITALTAILLPILLMLSVFSMNVAYMQLTKTELKVATDAAARAGGRAFSEYQDVNSAISFATQTAAQNKVAGDALTLSSSDIQFGWSQRGNNGYGRYEFTEASTAAVEAETADANAIRVWGKRDGSGGNAKIDLLFKGLGEFSTFEPVTSSVSTQVDRDIAMILDRSGSMAQSDINFNDYRTYQWVQHSWWIYTWYSYDQVLDPPEMEASYNTYVSQYNNWRNNSGYASVPDASRWKSLETAVNAFLDVLDNTDQEELISVASFSSSARLDLELQSTYQSVRDLVADIGNGVSSAKRVWGATAIGDGIDTGFPSLISSMGRPYAAKTVLVLTDGHNNSGSNPESVTQDILDDYNATFDAVTVSDGADQSLMEGIAELGGGDHYHADNEAELVTIFEEIANNLPTIITN